MKNVKKFYTNKKFIVIFISFLFIVFINIFYLFNFINGEKAKTIGDLKSATYYYSKNVQITLMLNETSVVLLANSYINSGQLQKAEILLNNAIKRQGLFNHKPDASHLLKLTLADLYSKQHKYNNAINTYKQIIPYLNNYKLKYTAISELAYNQIMIKNFTDAKKNLDSVIAYQKEHNIPVYASENYLNLGIWYFNKQEYELSEKTYNEILNFCSVNICSNSQIVKTLYNYFNLLVYKKEYDKGISIIKKYYNPKHFDYMQNAQINMYLGILYMFKDNREIANKYLLDAKMYFQKANFIEGVNKIDSIANKLGGEKL